MKENISIKEKINKELNQEGHAIFTGDSIDLINQIDDNTVKLLYGSPPYPNAKRNYKSWKIENYIDEISPFIVNAIPKLRDDGFIVINVKSNRTNPKTKNDSPERSLIIEELMIYMKKELNLYCVDIEIWIKSNPVPTGVRVSCQDAYEYNIWFSKSPRWVINIDDIRREYSRSTLNTYKNTIYKPRKNGLPYISKQKSITPHPLGALPNNVVINGLNDSFLKTLVLSNLTEHDIKEYKRIIEILSNDDNIELSNNITNQIIAYYSNIIYGAVSGKSVDHQAVQPEYLPDKYIKACTKKDDIVLDPWLGSGTTGVVCKKLDRKFIGFDISEEYTKLARENILKIKKSIEQEK